MADADGQADADAVGPERPAGAFGTWLNEMQAALDGAADADVPCDGCTACCRSSQFVHIGPEETDTLAHVPAALLFPAPGLPDGHVLLGYDEAGRCPLLAEDRCSIYEHRPRTCRTYDCRVFAAAGVLPDEPTKADVAARARTWRFDVSAPGDDERRDAVRRAAGFVRDHGDLLPGGRGPADATGVAVLAVEVSEVFEAERHDPNDAAAAVQVVLAARRRR